MIESTAPAVAGDAEFDVGDAAVSPRPDLRGRLLLVAAWIVLCAVALIILDRLFAPRTFYYDEWTTVLQRRTGGLDSLLAPHNGHLSLVPTLVFRTFFEVFGLDHYHPYRLAGLLCHLAVATLVFTYVRRRLGAIAGLAFGSLVLLLGAGWEDILWPWQIGFMGSVGAGIATWLALGRRTRGFDVVAAVALGVGLACSGLGIPVFIGTAAWLVAERNWKRLVRVLAVPALLYAIWYLVYGTSQGSVDNLKLLPRYFVDEAAGSVGALLGRDILWGRVLLGFIIGVVVMSAIAGRRVARCVIAPTVALLANWVLVGYSRADLREPASSRYVYVGAVYILLIASDVLQQWRGRRLTQLATVFAVVGIWGNWAVLHQGAGGLRWSTTFTRVELRALEWAAETVDPAYRPNVILMPPVVADQYLAAVKALGSPAATDGEVSAANNELRANTDLTSLQALRFALEPAEPITAPAGESVPADGSVVTLEPDSCVLLTARADRAAAQVTLPVGGRVLLQAGEAPVEVRLKRYADTYPAVPDATLASTDTAYLGITPDLAPVSQWMAELTSSNDFTVCSPPS